MSDISDIHDLMVHRDYWNDLLVEIVDNGDHRSLYFGSRQLQSRMSLSRPHELVLSYTWYMAAALLILPEPTKILIIGIGSGSFIRFFHHHFPDCPIDAVDYSQHVINIARGYFHLPESDRIAVHCQDGFRFLKENSTGQYDLILVDAFDDLGMAPTIYGRPFLSLCRQHLTEKGVLSCNLWSDDEVRYREIRTILADHFTGSLTLPVPDRGNIVALAMPCPVPWTRIYLKNRRFEQLSNRYAINFKQLARVIKRNNLSLTERLIARLS